MSPPRPPGEASFPRKNEQGVADRICLFLFHEDFGLDLQPGRGEGNLSTHANYNARQCTVS